MVDIGAVPGFFLRSQACKSRDKGYTHIYICTLEYFATLDMAMLSGAGPFLLNYPVGRGGIVAICTLLGWSSFIGKSRVARPSAPGVEAPTLFRKSTASGRKIVPRQELIFVLRVWSSAVRQVTGQD